MSAARWPPVRNGDMIAIDVAARTINLEISDEELKARLAAFVPKEAAGSARLCAAPRRPRDPGGPGLRLRLPGGHGAPAGAGDLLTEERGPPARSSATALPVRGGARV